MSVTEIPSAAQGTDWLAEKSTNVVRFLAPVIEANRLRRDLPRDLQEALDFFLSIALSDGLKLLSYASGRELTGRELTECVRLIRERGERGVDEVLKRVGELSPPPQAPPPQFELVVGMRALIDDTESVDLALIDDWLRNFDWRDRTVQELRELTARARAGELLLEHYLLSVRLAVDALEATEFASSEDDSSENLFLSVR